jgi:hypothetical protein
MTLGGCALVGCTQTPTKGPMADRFYDYAAGTGLGVALLGSGVIYMERLSAQAIREDIPLPAAPSRPAMLVDWGRGLVVLEPDSLRVIGLKGETIGELDQPANIDGCVLNREAMLLLFWGERRYRSGYGVYLGDLGAHRTTAIREWLAGAGTAPGKVTASFADRDASLVRIAFDRQSYRVRASGETQGADPWKLEWAEASTDGRFAAGRGANGNLIIVDVASSRTWDTDIPIIGPIRWDPSSRYVLAVKPVHALPWAAQTEIAIADAEMNASLVVPAIAPDERYHPYEWILRA